MFKNIFTALITSAVVCAIVLGVSLNKGQNLGGDFEVADKYNAGTIYARGGIKVGATDIPLINSSGQVTIGSTGSALTKVIKGTCDLTGGTITATTSAIGQCAVTGVVSGDLVFVSLASSTPTGAVVGAEASSTAGWISVRIANLSGVSKIVSDFGTTTKYLIIR